MHPERLLADLARPEAYPHPADAVEVVQTHISLVFLAGDHVWKVKKPVSLGFLDFGTLAKREFYCHEEVRLNRRLAADVYLGVEPITEQAGRLRFGGDGPPVEWAVHMRRLAADRTFDALLARDALTPALLGRLAVTLADFYRRFPAGPDEAAHGSFEAVAANALENYLQAAGQVGRTVEPAVFERLRRRTEAELEHLGPAFTRRHDLGRVRAIHGDLRLDHVYHEEGPDGGRLLLIDCVEFGDRLRFGDPAADLAFLVMDLARHGRRDLGKALIDAYVAAADDPEVRDLIDFYAGYRAVVRAKVAGMKAAEPEVPPAERDRARTDAAAHWLLAATFLEPPARRPCLVLVGGLPGSGKSTLARGLAEASGFAVVRSDVVRKELATGADLYSAAWTERTYAECLERARRLLRQGRRVVLDASFRSEDHRLRAVALGRDLGVPVRLLFAEVSDAVARARLASRHGDASDADWDVRRRLAAAWEPTGPVTGRLADRLNLEGSPAEGAALALRALAAADLEVDGCPNPGTNPSGRSPPSPPS